MLYATSYKQLSYLLFLSAAFPAVDWHLSTNNICYYSSACSISCRGLSTITYCSLLTNHNWACSLQLVACSLSSRGLPIVNNHSSLTIHHSPS